MDEISLLRRARTDIPERTPANVARGRAELFAQIEAETPYAPFAALGNDTSFTPQPLRHRRRRTFAWTGFSALGATALTVALVSGNLFGIGGWHGGADPAAADVLNAAALAALEVSDPQLSPGQYLRVRTDGSYLTERWLEEDVDAARVNGVVEDLGTIEPQYYMQGEQYEVFLPADRSDSWWWIQCRVTLDQTFGPKSELAAQQDPSFTGEAAGHLQEAPGGLRKYELPDGESAIGGPVAEYTTLDGSSDDYSQLPLDPRELLNEIYRFNGDSGQSRDGQALGWIMDTLRLGTVPAEHRAAMYQAAALIPGVTITDNQATLNGTTGIAFGRDETNSNVRDEMIIDPTTGQFIGERRIVLEDYGPLAAGSPLGWTAVTTEIVDTAPTDVSTCSQ